MIRGMVQGLRERKKEETRRHIAATAIRLFLEHGFDQVSVAQVAEAANVSKMTVFNYFPTKEDLALAPIEEHVADEARVVRERASGESALQALRRTYLAELAERATQTGLHEAAMPITRMVLEHEGLRARLDVWDQRRGAALAAALAEATGGDLLWARLAAAAFLAVKRVLVTVNFERTAAGDDPERALADARSAAEKAFSMLEDGLRGPS